MTFLRGTGVLFFFLRGVGIGQELRMIVGNSRSLQLGSTSSATESLESKKFVVVVVVGGSLNSPLPELATP